MCISKIVQTETMGMLSYPQIYSGSNKFWIRLSYIFISFQPFKTHPFWIHLKFVATIKLQTPMMLLTSVQLLIRASTIVAVLVEIILSF